MGEYGGMQRPGIVVDYQNKSSFGGPAGRGMKRKMPQPLNKPVGAFVNKKPKLAKPDAKTEGKNEEEEKRRVEARREKQRRRREKNSEKYGDGYRIAFTCSFCKFRTFEEKDIEAHLESTTHQETLDHIQKQTKFGKVVMQFLHECMVNKFKKTAMRKAQTNQNEAAKIAEKDILEGVSAEEHMMKVETVHCSACSAYVPALQSSVQQHIKSSDHAKSKLAYKELIKRESVLTATSILNNPIVKSRYELFAKGENPFELEQASEEAAEEAAEVVEEAAEVNEDNEEVQEEVNEEENEQNDEEEVDENEEESNDVEAAEPNDDPTTAEEN
ncbi:DBIRD complex subunit ZNF326-like isoform X2 [Ambystoma mexicanum]